MLPAAETVEWALAIACFVFVFFCVRLMNWIEPLFQVLVLHTLHVMKKYLRVDHIKR